MYMFTRIICLLGGYCFGLIQTSYLYGKLKGIDIRQSGSGNAGTTNALRVLGKKAGLIVFLGDFLKGVVACTLVHVIFNCMDFNNVYLYVLYAGFGVVLGHNFPFYMQFKGGKGIAATSGMILGLWDWRIVLIEFIIFVLVVGITKYVSLGSICLVVGFFILYTVFAIKGFYDFTSDSKMIESIVVAGVITLLAIIRHSANIKRLLSGTENKLSFKSKKEA